MPQSHARRMNLVALALLVTALIAFIAFHFLPWWQGPDEFWPGWKLWPEIFREIASMRMDEEIVASMAFITIAVLVVAGPFMIRVLQRSRLFWWLGLVVSASASVCLTGIIVISMMWQGGDARPGPGFACLIASQILFFIGLLFIRREAAPDLMAEVTL